MSFQNQSRLNIYKQEVTGHIRSIREGLVQLLKDPYQGKVIDEVIRSAHTIKSASRMLNYQNVAAFGAYLESFFTEFKEQSQTLTLELSEEIEATLKKTDSAVDEIFLTVEQKEEKRGQVGSVAATKNGPALNLLVVEDDPLAGSLLKDILQQHDAIETKVVLARSLKEAKDSLVDQKYDVILLDLILPDSAGIESLNEIKKRVQKIPIIIMTGSEDPKMKEAVLKRGAFEMLTKGALDIEILFNTIEKAVAAHQKKGPKNIGPNS